MDGKTDAERRILTQLLYEYAGRASEGPYASGQTAIKAQQVEEAIRTAVKPPPGSPSIDVYKEIARGAGSGPSKVGLWPRMFQIAGPVLGTTSAGVTAFSAGFAIGTGLNERWLHIGTEAVSEGTGFRVPQRTRLALYEAGYGAGMLGGEPSVDRFVWQWTDDAPSPNELWHYHSVYTQLTGPPCGLQINAPTAWRLSVSPNWTPLCNGPPSVFGKSAIAYALPEDLIDEPIRARAPGDVPARSTPTLPPNPGLSANSPTVESLL